MLRVNEMSKCWGRDPHAARSWRLPVGLGYRDRACPYQAGATLVFEIELFEIIAPSSCTQQVRTRASGYAPFVSLSLKGHRDGLVVW